MNCRMMLVTVTLTCFLTLLIACPANAGWKPKPGSTRIKGRIVYESGDTLKFSDMLYAGFESDQDNNPLLAIEYKTTARTIPVAKISYLMIVNRTCGKYGLARSEIEIGLKDGNKIYAILLDPLKSIQVGYIDEITKEKQNTYVDFCSNHGLVKLIYFDEVGSMAFNTRTKEYYPASYNFDPYTGEKLVKQNPE